MGRVWKVSTSIEISHRCPLNVRNSSIASISIKRASTGIFRRLPGSKKVAKERPICRPIISPAVRIAAKANCMVKPSIMPINICCAASQKPEGEKIVTPLMGSVGATIQVIISARPIFTFLEMERSLSMGAVLISAIMRKKGQKPMLSKFSHWSLSTWIIQSSSANW